METVLIPQFTIVNSLIGQYDSPILPRIASAFNIYLFRNFFIAIPEEIIESAKLDGASILKIFFSIMLPMSKPAIATVGVLSFIGSWNDYIWPLMVLTDRSKFSMQVAITTINTTQPVYINQVMAVLTISTIPLIIVRHRRGACASLQGLVVRNRNQIGVKVCLQQSKKRISILKPTAMR